MLHNITLLVIVFMYPGDLASVSVTAAVTRPPDVHNACDKFIS